MINVKYRLGDPTSRAWHAGNVKMLMIADCAGLSIQQIDLIWLHSVELMATVGCDQTVSTTIQLSTATYRNTEPQALSSHIAGQFY